MVKNEAAALLRQLAKSQRDAAAQGRANIERIKANVCSSVNLDAELAKFDDIADELDAIAKDLGNDSPPKVSHPREGKVGSEEETPVELNPDGSGTITNDGSGTPAEPTIDGDAPIDTQLKSSETEPLASLESQNASDAEASTENAPETGKRKR